MSGETKDEKKKMKKRFLKAAAGKIVLRFKKNYEKSKTYLQRTVKRNEKTKDGTINRAHVWELYKNAQMLFSFPSNDQLQIVEEIAHVLKEGTPLFQDNVTTNVVACLHDAVQIAINENMNPPDIKVVLRSLDLLFSGIELKPTHMKLMAADTIGLMLAHSADTNLTRSITTKIILGINNGSFLCRSVNSYIYACIHRYTEEIKPKEKDITTIFEIVQNCSCEIAQCFALNALVILTNKVEKEIIILILSTCLSILSKPILPSKKILTIIGQILSLSATMLKEISENQTILSECLIIMKSSITILISQKHEEVQAVAFKIMFLIYNEEPASFEVKDLFRIIIDFLKSGHEGKIVEAAVFLNHLLLYDLPVCYAFINDPYMTEHGSFEEFFFEIMQHESITARPVVENVLSNLIINPELFGISKKISIVQFFWFGKKFSIPLQNETKQEYESDVENLYGLYLNDKPVIAPNWRTRVFALMLLQTILCKITTTSVDKHVAIKEVDLPEIIKIAFVATTDINVELRRQGLSLIKEILNNYGSLADLDYPEQSILEQYQTQIVTALVHSLERNASVEELNAGCEAITILLKSGIVSDTGLVKRLCHALTAELVCVENGTFTGEKDVCLSFLQTWAEIYCIMHVQKDIYERLPTKHKELFEQLNDSDFDILTTLWLDAVNKNWEIQSDANDIVYTTSASNNWSSIFLALSDRLSKANDAILKFSDYVVFKTMVNAICYILINNSNENDEACNKVYLYSLSILISFCNRFNYSLMDFSEVIRKALCSVLCMNEQKIIRLLPALLSITTVPEWQIFLDFTDFNEKLIAFVRRIMISRNNKTILDMYNSFYSLHRETKLNSLIILYLMPDFLKLMSVENYDIVLKKEELIRIQMTVAFVEYLADNIDLERKNTIITSLVDSLLRLLIVDVFDFWDQYCVERQHLHKFALEKLRSYASFYPSELRTILLQNKILAMALNEGLKHQIECIAKNTNTHNLMSQNSTIQLKTRFQEFEDA